MPFGQHKVLTAEAIQNKLKMHFMMSRLKNKVLEDSRRGMFVTKYSHGRKHLIIISFNQ